MRIISLKLKNFRNYEDGFVNFSPGINLIIGKNGSGKTNLLEALYIFVTGRSFRTHRLSDLIGFGKNFFSLELTFTKNEVEQTLRFVATAEQKKIFHNDTALTQLSDLFGLLRGVILSPTDSELIMGYPACRRLFIDLHCSQLSSEYLQVLSRYMKSMKHRNSLLRSKEVNGIEVWDEEMAKSAFFLTKERKKAIVELNDHANPFQAHLSQNMDQLVLHYKSLAKDSDDVVQFYRDQYKSSLSKELERGYTLTGPHKDDLAIFLGEKEAKVFASVGQVRSTALSLRFAELKRFQKLTSEMPLFFLDDLAMGLDKLREKNLYEHIAKCPQSFLTSPDSSVLSQHLKGHIIEIDQGLIKSL